MPVRTETNPPPRTSNGMTLTIEDRCPPSLNKVLRMHWATKRRLNEEWTLAVWGELVRRGPYLKPIAKMRCKITLCHSRLYDKDNAYGAVKPIVDALKRNQLIFDDTPEYLDLSVEQTKCKHKQRHTIVELEGAMSAELFGRRS